MTEHSKTPGPPGYVMQLKAAYGGPSQKGFGSAVFHETLASTLLIAGRRGASGETTFLVFLMD